jgi:hypothetical protein
MSRAMKLAATTAVTVLTALAMPTPAHADSWTISVNAGNGWVHDSATPLFNVDRLPPGYGQTATLMVRNDSQDAAALSLSATDLVEFENGCMHAEAVIDTTCGATQGEIGKELIFSVFADPENDGTYEATPRWTGTLYDLATPATLASSLPGGGIVGLRVDMTLPFSSGNETQTDSVDFAFRFTLAGAGGPVTPGTSGNLGSPSTGPGAGTTTPQGPGSVEVKGIKATRHPHSGVLHDITSQLPFTGAPLERLVAGGLWLVIVGTALSMLARVRRRRRTAPY